MEFCFRGGPLNGHDANNSQNQEDSAKNHPFGDVRFCKPFGNDFCQHDDQDRVDDKRHLYAAFRKIR